MAEASGKIIEFANILPGWNRKPWIGIHSAIPVENEEEDCVYYVCIEAPTEYEASDEINYINIPSQKYVIVSKEPGDPVQQVYGSIKAYLEERGLEMSYEETSYIVEIPKDDEWGSMEVWFPVKGEKA